jgi:assimilatory nitrate reductase catalytic subunit
MSGRNAVHARVKRLIGLDTAADRYAYAEDPVSGYVSAQKTTERWVATTCGYCSVGCGLFIGVKNGKAVAVRGNPDHPVNRGMLCPKGLSEHHTIDSPLRARYPMRRRKGRLVRTTWEDALGTMVSGFRTVQERYGHNAVGVISTGQLVTEEFYTLGKLVQLGIRTRNYDGNTTLCMSTAVAGYKRSFGSDGPPGAYEDLEHADVILLVGANIADNHPILCRRLQQNPGTMLIVADPRVTKTAAMADLHLPVRPRSDLALINGLIHLVIEHDLVDRGYVERHTTGFEALRESVREYTPERVATITGLAPEVVYRVAWIYANARAAFIGWTMGVNHSTKGTETVNAINNLALITGNIGRAGAAPFSITGQCNAMGTRGQASRRACQVTVASRTPPTGPSSPTSGTSHPSASPRHGVSPIPTSSRRCSREKSAHSGSSARIRSCRFRTWACCSVRSASSSCSWSRMAITRRPQPNMRTSCCPRPSGARRTAPIPTLSVE